MIDLRSKYDDLLEIMSFEYGEDLTFCDKDFAERIQRLMYIFISCRAINDRTSFDIMLKPDNWKWHHYIKVLEELQAIGAVDENWTAIVPECQLVKEEIQRITEDDFYD